MLPLSLYGLASADDFRNVQKQLCHQEWLKRAGLTHEEFVLYQENHEGRLGYRDKIEASVLRKKLDIIHEKIKDYENISVSLEDDHSSSDEMKNTTHNPEIPTKFYPEGHPIHELKQLDENLFGHLKMKTLPITKRRKMLRRLERKKQRILQETKGPQIDLYPIHTANQSGSLWDIKERSLVIHESSVISVHNEHKRKSESCIKNRFIGPKKPAVYTIKDNKIVRLEPVDRHRDEFRAVDIVVPVNVAEEKLLEGTKMSLEHIMKIGRFKDYSAGTPSKVLYLKNIAPNVSQEQLLSLFEQFTEENGGNLDVRLMSGRMRGQAFVSFKDKKLAARALAEVNGVIINGRPIIIQYGKSSNRIQTSDNIT